MSNFLNGFVDELTKEAGDGMPPVVKPKGTTMESLTPKKPDVAKPPPAPKPLDAGKPVAYGTGSGCKKTAGVKDMLGTMGSAVKKMVGKSKASVSGRTGGAGKTRKMKAADAGETMRMGAEPQHTRKMMAQTGPAKHRAGEAAKKVKARAESAVFDARSFAAKGRKMTKDKWNSLTPKQQRDAKAAGVILPAAIVGAAAYEKISEDKAGAMVKAVIKGAKGKQRPANDVGDTMVDQYGGGLGNFEGKTAPKFNKKFNPTDMPQAFPGKK